MNPRRLYRSRRERQLAGVAGGIAEYLEVDPTIVRILWILSIFLGGFGIVLYIVMAFIVPMEPFAIAGPGPRATWPGPGADRPADGGAAPDGTSPDGAAADGTAPSAAWQASSQWPASPSWAANPAWTTAAGDGSVTRGGRGGLIVGVMLIVFGSIALATVLLPGWAFGFAFGPALLVALGIALLVGAARRPAVAQ